MASLGFLNAVGVGSVVAFAASTSIVAGAALYQVRGAEGGRGPLVPGRPISGGWGPSGPEFEKGVRMVVIWEGPEG